MTKAFFVCVNLDTNLKGNLMRQMLLLLPQNPTKAWTIFNHVIGTFHSTYLLSLGLLIYFLNII
jgi:hypothetical protein